MKVVNLVLFFIFTSCSSQKSLSPIVLNQGFYYFKYSVRDNTLNYNCVKRDQRHTHYEELLSKYEQARVKLDVMNSDESFAVFKSFNSSTIYGFYKNQPVCLQETAKLTQKTKKISK